MRNENNVEKQQLMACALMKEVGKIEWPIFHFDVVGIEYSHREFRGML